MSRRGRLGFLAACLLVFGLIAALITWGPPSTEPPGTAPATVTLVPGATRPAGLAVTDLNDVGQLQERFNADRVCRGLVLAWPRPEGSVLRAPGGRTRTSSSATRTPAAGLCGRGQALGTRHPSRDRRSGHGRPTGDGSVGRRTWSTKSSWSGSRSTSAGWTRLLLLFDRDALEPAHHPRRQFRRDRDRRQRTGWQTRVASLLG